MFCSWFIFNFRDTAFNCIENSKWNGANLQNQNKLFWKKVLKIVYTGWKDQIFPNFKKLNKCMK